MSPNENGHVEMPFTGWLISTGEIEGARIGNLYGLLLMSDAFPDAFDEDKYWRIEIATTMDQEIHWHYHREEA